MNWDNTEATTSGEPATSAKERQADLQTFWAMARPAMPDIVDACCHDLLSVSDLKLAKDFATDQWKQAQIEHFQSLSAGFDTARATGRSHHEAGLLPQCFVLFHEYVRDSLTSLVFQDAGWPDQDKNRIMSAIRDVMARDLGFVISGYAEAIVEAERQRHAEHTRREVARVLTGLPSAAYRCRYTSDGMVVRFEFMANVDRLTGWNTADMRDREAWMRNVVNMDCARWLSYTDDLLNKGEASIEYEFQHRDGTTRRLRDQARVVACDDGGEAEVVGYITDVTSEHVMREKALAAAKMATLGEMATGLAHELNQPISIMSLAAENAAEMLRLSGPAAIEAAVRRMGRICDQSNRARTIINHLRVFGHRGEAELTEVSLARIVEGALSIVDAAMRASEIVVENHVTDDVPTVTGGTVMAEQVLVNVLLNARDALSQIARSRGRHIRIDTERDFLTRSISLMVTDNGPGVPTDLRERIFEPFFTTKEVGKGTGLGLAICHGIMKSFGGAITVEDNEEGGARFVMRFVQAETGVAQLVRGSNVVMPEIVLN